MSAPNANSPSHVQGSMRSLLFLLLLSIASCMSRPQTNPATDRAATTDTDDVRVLYDFTDNPVRQHWRVEDDVVMGGRSSGQMAVTDDGFLRFSGEVSLENNGGFSSVQHEMDETIDLSDRVAFVIRLKGDGKTYNFRVKRPGQRHAYTYPFETKAGQWETITIPFDAMYATWRGNRPDVPNYAGEPINTLRFLIGNKKPQEFELVVAEIGAS